VYVAFVVVVAGLSAWVEATVARRTLARWEAWWRGRFVETAFFRAARARFMPPLCEARLPGSLIERFAGAGGDAGADGALFAALVFVSPITTSSAASSFSRDGP
jgi:hypothetical protein